MPHVLIIDKQTDLPGPNRHSRWDGVARDLEAHGLTVDFLPAFGPHAERDAGDELAAVPASDIVVIGPGERGSTRQILATALAVGGRSVTCIKDHASLDWVPFAMALARQSGEGEVVATDATEIVPSVLRRFGLTTPAAIEPLIAAWMPGALPTMYAPPGGGIPIGIWQETFYPARGRETLWNDAPSAMAKWMYATFRLRTGQGLADATVLEGDYQMCRDALRYLRDDELALHRDAIEGALEVHLAGYRDVVTADSFTLALNGENPRPEELLLILLAMWRGVSGRGASREAITTARAWWDAWQSEIYRRVVADACSAAPVEGGARNILNLVGAHLPATGADPLVSEGFQFTNRLTWDLAACHRDPWDVVREATRRLPGRLWVRREAASALRTFVQAHPPRSEAEAHAWEEVMREIRNLTALYAVAEGCAEWPWVPEGCVSVAEVYHARGGRFSEDVVRSLVGRSLPAGDRGRERLDAIAGHQFLGLADLVLQKGNEIGWSTAVFSPTVVNAPTRNRRP